MRLPLRAKVFTMAALCLGSAMPFALAADEAAKPKHTIKEVMKIAHGKESTLLKNVLAGKGTMEEKHQLLDLYISMVESKPSKGEMESWHKLAGAAAVAAAKVVVGREGAVEELKIATDCKACHTPHK